MIRRLRKKFIRITVFAAALVLILLSLIVNIANFISVDASLTQMLKMIHENEGTIPPLPRYGKPEETANGPFSPETPYSTRYFVLRYSGQNELWQADLDNIAAITSDDTDKYLKIAVRHGKGFGYTSGYKYYVAYNGENRWMAIFLDSHREMQSVTMIALLSLVATAICIFLVYIIVVLFSRRAIDPAVKSTQLQKQFITDASHELKTPITVINTSLKVLEMEIGRQKWIDKARLQTEKLKDLVNSLVTLSRMDEEESPLRFHNFNISDSIRETAESFQEFASSHGHELKLFITPELHYYGDEYAVRQLASILLDNAVKYAVSDTPIFFALEKERKYIALRTVNNCKAVDTAELNKLFNRFYRSDEARAKNDGFGIGLSIARSIAEGHKGSVYAQCKDECSIEFTAKLKLV